MERLDWQNNTEEYFLIKNEARHIILHPEIIKYINEKKPAKILDFGCGDGSLLMNLDNSFTGEITLYDINKDVLSIAQNNLSHLNTKIISTFNDIPEDSFDLIILSCVLLAVKDDRTYHDIVGKLFKAKNNKGILLLGTTHPCFRNYKFGTFTNEYVKDSKSFNYFKNCDGFNVYIPDKKSKEIVFVDYHRTLSNEINVFSEIGFRLKEMLELKDKPFKAGCYFNQDFPSFIILIFE
jgi:SAM-dependent methyltransferase